MSVINPFRHLTRVAAIAAMGGALALGTTACGAGQIAQTTNQAAAVNGSFATLGDIALRDVHVVFPSSGSNAEFVNGGPLQLAFLISNNSPYKNDRLESISLPGGGTVTASGDTSIPATKSLRAGNPSQLLTVPSSEAQTPGSDPTEQRISVTITGAGKQITPGLAVQMKFTFAQAGSTVLRVPVDAGTLPRDQNSILNEGSGGEGEGEG